MSKSATWVRTGSVAAMVAVPALAVAFLSGSWALSVPSLQLTETREFNRAGQNISVITEKKAGEQVDVYLGEWQNTVRTAPTPRV